MACKVLLDSHLMLSHQGRVSGQDDGKSTEHGHCDWRTLENFFFPTVHVAMVHEVLAFI